MCVYRWRWGGGSLAAAVRREGWLTVCGKTLTQTRFDMNEWTGIINRGTRTLIQLLRWTHSPVSILQPLQFSGCASPSTVEGACNCSCLLLMFTQRKIHNFLWWCWWWEKGKDGGRKDYSHYFLSIMWNNMLHFLFIFSIIPFTSVNVSVQSFSLVTYTFRYVLFIEKK